MYTFVSVLVGLLAVTTIALPAPQDPPAPAPPAPQTFPMADDAACSCQMNFQGQQIRIPLNNTMPPFSGGLAECLPGTVIGGCPVAKEP